MRRSADAASRASAPVFAGLKGVTPVFAGLKGVTPVFAGLKGVTPVFAGYGATGDTRAPVIYPT